MSDNHKPAGYLYLRNYLKDNGIETLPHFKESYILEKGNNRIEETEQTTRYFYKLSYNPKNEITSHIEFALKYEGVNLQILSELFTLIPESNLYKYIIKTPTSKYTRMIWFLYEWLTENKLDINDLKNVGYIDILNTDNYYTANSIKCKRFAINNNLLGNNKLCPVIRKTPLLENLIASKLDQRAQNLINNIDPIIIKRAIGYLYNKETKSSLEIEKETPNKSRTDRFMKLLYRLNEFEDLSKEFLIEIQNSIVDQRYKETDYRNIQNFIGQTIGLSYEEIYYIPPGENDVKELMDNFIAIYNQIIHSNLHPILIATLFSFGFVYIHPFEDGNGRLHRFLIHYILNKKKFIPENIIFPVSATMLENIKDYDDCLDSFSKPLMTLLRYSFNTNNKLIVDNNRSSFYRYMDMTVIAEYLFNCIEKTIENTFKIEIKFLENYDIAKKEIQDIVDMPDRLIDLFIQITGQNKGKLSKRKKDAHFNKLTDDEIEKLEEVIQEYFLD